MKKCKPKPVPLACKVNECVGEENIANMWKLHFSNLLNSVKDYSKQEEVLDFLSAANCDCIIIKT